jgi:hypothetical protein
VSLLGTDYYAKILYTLSTAIIEPGPELKGIG